ncbi:D-glycero-beta-D-manno-heptose-7-phosphate kinase [Maricaulis sp. D1M11]|uniref:D-glycero-beta-D-manno-heptose-7-phosphate kinase n=1 Tax=Maricaulis sp. D1M11 TaxID=3076117 RepID=UPI0039B3A1FA
MTVMSQWVDALAGVRLAVLGDVMLDRYTFGDTTRISPEAPTPVFLTRRVEEMVGGAGNVARNIAALGGEALLIGAIGKDETGRVLQARAGETEGLDARFVRNPNQRTTVKNRFVAKGQHVLRVDEEDQGEIPAEVVQTAMGALDIALDGTSALVLSDYAKGFLTKDILTTAIAKARARGLPVIIDPKSKDLQRYSGATVLTPNAKEAEDATGIACDTPERAEAAARAILELAQCETVILTRGPQGMTVCTRDGTLRHMPTLAREVFDVSGAGDTVVATLALALASGAPVEAAADLANRAAGIVVGKVGTATVSAAELHIALHGGGPDGRKTVNRDAARAAVRTWQAAGHRVVFTNGCFDLLHPGHVSLLDFAKSQGDRLVVALNSDASVQRLKGPTRPVQTESARSTVMEALRDVDLVVIFDEDTPLETIIALEPDVLVKGADYTVDQVVGAREVMARGGQVALAPLLDGHSTTNSIKRATIRADD